MCLRSTLPVDDSVIHHRIVQTHFFMLCSQCLSDQCLPDMNVNFGGYRVSKGTDMCCNVVEMSKVIYLSAGQTMNSELQLRQYTVSVSDGWL